MKFGAERPIRKRWKTGTLFGGEVMTCRGCGKQLKSDPRIESGWNHFRVGDDEFYVCPDCFAKMISGGDGS